MEEAQRQLDELDEEDKKREAERSRKKIHKAFAPSRPVSTPFSLHFHLPLLCTVLASCKHACVSQTLTIFVQAVAAVVAVVRHKY